MTFKTLFTFGTEYNTEFKEFQGFLIILDQGSLTANTTWNVVAISHANDCTLQ